MRALHVYRNARGFTLSDCHYMYAGWLPVAMQWLFTNSKWAGKRGKEREREKRVGEKGIPVLSI